jgi:hypothetical protein
VVAGENFAIVTTIGYYVTSEGYNVGAKCLEQAAMSAPPNCNQQRLQAVQIATSRDYN